MHRRGFLGLLGAVVAAPFAPDSAPPFSGIDCATGSDGSMYSIVVTREFIEDLAEEVQRNITRNLRYDGAREAWTR